MPRWRPRWAAGDEQFWSLLSAAGHGSYQGAVNGLFTPLTLTLSPRERVERGLRMKVVI